MIESQKGGDGRINGENKQDLINTSNFRKQKTFLEITNEDIKDVLFRLSEILNSIKTKEHGTVIRICNELARLGIVDFLPLARHACLHVLLTERIVCSEVIEFIKTDYQQCEKKL